MKVVLTALALLAGGAPSAEAAERPFNLTIAAGKIGEVCMPLDVGTTLAWRFKASAPVDFNLHHHVDNDTKNDWCPMWSAPADRRVTVVGAWSAKQR